jgi:hypothetical protein
MAAKRTRKTGSSSDSMMADADQATGQTVGSAGAANESAVGMRSRPDGYEKVQTKEGRQTTAADTGAAQPRNRKRATPKSARSQTKTRGRSKSGGKARKTR